MSTSGQAKYSPELMDPQREAVLRGALTRLYETGDITDIWPAASDARANGYPIPIENVEIVVLSLDRIGAPAGFSGAKVYVAYYRDLTEGSDRRRPSTPLVVKIGKANKLTEEMRGVGKWPRLAPTEKAKFAFPISLDDKDANWAVLIAPFQSDVRLEEDGSRNIVEVRDLWRFLEDKDELISAGVPDWGEIHRLVAEALDAVAHPHAFGRAVASREPITYAEDYDWYLRATGPGERGRHIPDNLFGSDLTVKAFGETWPNPTSVVDRIISKKIQFDGIRGAVHGDLHPKNIVLSPQNHVQIIDFGWAWHPRHVIVDYVLLDLNLRGTTLPSQVKEADIISLAGFLHRTDDPVGLHPSVQERAKIIKGVIWERALRSAVKDWDYEYLIPLFLVGYGLLVHLDSARNQFALKATVLQLSRHIHKLLEASVTT